MTTIKIDWTVVLVVFLCALVILPLGACIGDLGNMEDLTHEGEKVCAENGDVYYYTSTSALTSYWSEHIWHTCTYTIQVR